MVDLLLFVVLFALFVFQARGGGKDANKKAAITGGFCGRVKKAEKKKRRRKDEEKREKKKAKEKEKAREV